VPAVKQKFPLAYIQSKRLFNQPIDPHALDDAGAVCASMIKAQRSGLTNNLRPMIDNYINYVFTKEYRLKEGGEVWENGPEVDKETAEATKLLKEILAKRSK
jgi:hypothetical protein